MKRLSILSFFVLTILIVITNIPIISGIIDINRNYAYSNGDGTLTMLCDRLKENHYPNYQILKTTGVDSMQPSGTLQHPIYPPNAGAVLRETYPNADTVMYRLFWKNPLCFWQWREYFNKDMKYQFPYKNWKEIETKRPKDFILNKNYQTF